MSLSLPGPIAAYLTAANDADVAAAFTPDAVVRDEGRTINGHEAIAAWRAETQRKYNHTVEPLGVVERDGRVVVRARVTGNFPGSPISLDYAFEMRGDKIASLRIA